MAEIIQRQEFILKLARAMMMFGGPTHRLQAQMHSLADPLEAPRYRNAGHAVYTIVREEGVRTLYRGVSLTALRQATNQGAHDVRVSTLSKQI